MTTEDASAATEALFRETVAGIINALPECSAEIDTTNPDRMILRINAPTEEAAQLIRITAEALAYTAICPYHARDLLLSDLQRRLFQAVGFPVDEMRAIIERAMAPDTTTH